LKALDPVSPRL